MLLTNQRLDKLAAARVDFTARGMLDGPLPGLLTRLRVQSSRNDANAMPTGTGKLVAPVPDKSRPTANTEDDLDEAALDTDRILDAEVLSVRTRGGFLTHLLLQVIIPTMSRYSPQAPL